MTRNSQISRPAETDPYAFCEFEFVDFQAQSDYQLWQYTGWPRIGLNDQIHFIFGQLALTLTR